METKDFSNLTITDAPNLLSMNERCGDRNQVQSNYTGLHPYQPGTQ